MRRATGLSRGEAGRGPAPPGGDWRQPCAAGSFSPDLAGCDGAQRAVGGGAERVAAVGEWAAGVGAVGEAGGGGEWGVGLARGTKDHTTIPSKLLR